MNLSSHLSVISDRWVSCSKPNPQAKLSLFCFPYAGAGSTVFNAWFKILIPEEAFLETIQQDHGALQAIIFKQPQMLQVFMEIMWADAALVESHVHRRYAGA